MNTSYYHPDYHTDHPLVPHGISVAVTAPSVFKFTAPSDPERHLKAASLFGVDVSNVKRESAGEVLAEAIQEFMFTKLKHQPRGVSALGYKRSDISALVDGAVPQRRVLDLAPVSTVLRRPRSERPLPLFLRTLGSTKRDSGMHLLNKRLKKATFVEVLDCTNTHTIDT